MTCSTPAVAGGKVFIGTASEGQSVLLCLDEQTGKLLWQLTCPPRDVPKVIDGRKLWFSVFPPTLGICSSPAVDGDRGDRRRKDTIIGKNDGTFVGMSEIIATPVFYRNRVYVAIGRDPEHGRGRGALWCLDAGRVQGSGFGVQGTGARGQGPGAREEVARDAETLDGSPTGLRAIWCYKGLDRTLSTVSIADGLLYVADVAGRLHCLDADTGRCLWVHETKAKIWGSTLVADGKVYLPTEKHLWVFAAGRDKRVLSQMSLGAPVWATPIAANGVLYVASTRCLWAVRMKD
jgi:outer membrane protein assembly factor BamB